jgi:hypothetical protein
MTKRTEITVHQGELAPIPVETLQARVSLVHKALKSVMQDGTHYGTIPGTGKPALFKAGSEILLTMFQIAVDPEVEDLSTADRAAYRVRAVGRHQATGTVVGTGIGEASSDEEKYRWREAVCAEEYDSTPETHRRIKWKKGYQGGPATSVHQVRTHPSDVANTVLKMAKKRAQIDLSLTATGASDIFTQDVLEDPEDRSTDGRPAPASRPTRPAAATGKPETASAKQIGLVRARAKAAGLTDQDVAAGMGIEALEALPWRLVDNALNWISANAAPPPDGE